MPGLVDATGRMVLEQGRRIEQVSKLDAILSQEERDEEEAERNKEDSGSEEDKAVSVPDPRTVANTCWMMTTSTLVNKTFISTTLSTWNAWLSAFLRLSPELLNVRLIDLV